MVGKRGLATLVYSEAVIGAVVGVGNSRASPRLFALDAEVVVCHAREVAIAESRLEDSLTHSDACRYAIYLHILDSGMSPLVDILLGSELNPLVGRLLRLTSLGLGHLCRGSSHRAKSNNYNAKQPLANIFEVRFHMQSHHMTQIY